MLTLTAEQQLIQQTARDFALREIYPFAALWSEQCTFPLAATQKLGQLGFLGMLVDQQWGGTQAGYLAYILALEEIAAADGSVATIMAVQNSLVGKLINDQGNDWQRQTYLTKIASGEWVGAFALSEPQAGSDAAALQTRAVLQNDHYIINGNKQFISSGKNAQLAVVFAMTDPSAGKNGISAFLVPTDTEGYQVVRVEKKMGQHATDTAALHFENLKIPATHLLGQAGKGYRYAMQNLAVGRIAIAAQAIGLARHAFEQTVNYSKERQTFGKPLIEHQAVAFDLADMATQIDAARLLTWRAAQMCEENKSCLKEASMAKLFASEMAEIVCHTALQRHGGYGYLQDFPLERIYRDVRVTTIYEGTSDIQRMIISRELAREG